MMPEDETHHRGGCSNFRMVPATGRSVARSITESRHEATRCGVGQVSTVKTGSLSRFTLARDRGGKSVDDVVSSDFKIIRFQVSLFSSDDPGDDSWQTRRNDGGGGVCGNSYHRPIQAQGSFGPGKDVASFGSQAPELRAAEGRNQLLNDSLPRS